jgi:hypothetical protein
MTSAIVKLETRPHRVVAQEHWNLTDEQMKGMHVHHRIPRSQGGTNDPSNLFVCSPSFHFHAWHGANSRLNLIKQATENAKKGGQKGGLRALELGVGIHAMDHSAKAKRLFEARKGIFAYTPEERRAVNVKAGTVSGELHKQRGTGVCSIPPEEHAKRMANTNSQRWECPCCGFVSNAKTVNAHMLKEHQLDKMHKHKHKHKHHGFIK